MGYCKATTHSRIEMVMTGWFRHRWAQFSEMCWCGLMQTLYTRTYTLYSILCWTGSQCSWSRTSVVMRLNFCLCSKIREAALNTFLKSLDTILTVVYPTSRAESFTSSTDLQPMNHKSVALPITATGHLKIPTPTMQLCAFKMADLQVHICTNLQDCHIHLSRSKCSTDHTRKGTSKPGYSIVHYVR